ncbi:hypothetical protein B0H13DRAFT_1964345 [Mycena leptocephala]|nr:hypothetical protein B0H13DRAFT_1964345 [Mycena leptocephala]
MNMFPPGTRIFYWNGANQAVYGTIQTVARTQDGTVVVNIRDDSGRTITLPYVDVFETIH